MLRKVLLQPMTSVPCVFEFTSLFDFVFGLIVTPTLKAGHWDYLIHCHKPKDEHLPYPQQQLFNPYENIFTPIGLVNEDIDPREGVMS
ncbi:unnamed protein product [Mycena citricolor]|uniref:Uncharacterized protein n=1 Tax=Mycena citricolor TaxID=2018698 RepID=A0AAD2HQS6_9AGAR|nr:unnamed protein product [Mycena citricolor]